MPQFGRPNSTSQTGSIFQPIGAATNHECLDEVAADDNTTYVRATVSSTIRAVTFSLTPVTNPNIDSGHILRWRAQVPSGGTLEETIELIQLPGVLIKSITNSYPDGVAVTPEQWYTRSASLSESEAALLVDYAGLQVTVRQRLLVANPNFYRITWIELEVPNPIPLAISKSDGILLAENRTNKLVFVSQPEGERLVQVIDVPSKLVSFPIVVR